MRFLFVLILPLSVIAQKNCKGFIVDKTTGNRVPYATVGLIAENKGTSANENGDFDITAFLPEKDSLRISSVGYKPITLAVSGWNTGDKIVLEREVRRLAGVTAAIHQRDRVYTLNPCAHCSGNSFSIAEKTITQLAQRFDAPNEGMLLSELAICKDGAESVFRVRVYDVDSISQGPAQDLVDTLIEIRSDKKQVRVNLEQYHIIIPGRSFFVAIEWIFIPFNEKAKNEDNEEMAVTMYRPSIKWVTNNKMKKGNVWQLHFWGRWSEMYGSMQDQKFQITTKLR